MQNKMKNAIKKALNTKRKNFAIYPFGMQGKAFKEILNKEFGIEETLLIDNLSKENDVKRLEDIEPDLLRNCTVFLVSDNSICYYELRMQLLKYCKVNNIVDVLGNEKESIENIERLFKKQSKKVYFNPIMGSKLCPPQDKADIRYVGDNTGNIVFSESILEWFEYDFETGLTAEWTRERLGKNNVWGIMPASNFLCGTSKWFLDLIPILESTDMHFTLAGVGAQASFEETPKDVIEKLSDEQKYFFKLVSERAISIGARGEFTAECLKLLGIQNVEVIGCPSFFQYKSDYPKLNECSSKKILYTADKEKQKIYDLVKNYNAHIISQVYSDSEKESKIFFDFKEWNDYIVNANFSFAFGTRFHGNMMALRNQVPTLWVAHDWRTLELVQYLGLPHINWFDKKFQNAKCIEELFPYCDYSEVYKHYSEKYAKYQQFILRNFGEM